MRRHGAGSWQSVRACSRSVAAALLRWRRTTTARRSRRWWRLRTGVGSSAEAGRIRLRWRRSWWPSPTSNGALGTNRHESNTNASHPRAHFEATVIDPPGGWGLGTGPAGTPLRVIVTRPGEQVEPLAE